MVKPVDIALKISDLQYEVYQLHDADHAPNDDAEYQEWEDWIADQIRKSTYADFITEDVVDYLDEINAHMAASAANTVMRERS